MNFFLLRNLLIFYIPILCLNGCSKNEKTIPKDFEQVRKKLPVQEGENIQYLYTEETQLKAYLQAPRFREVLDTNQHSIVYFDSTFTIIFFNSEGKKESQLTANRGLYHNRKGYAEAKGNVIVVNEKNEKLETEQLFWYKHNDKLSTNAFVKITRNEEILFGDSLVSNTSFNNYKIYKLKGRIQKPKNF